MSSAVSDRDERGDNVIYYDAKNSPIFYSDNHSCCHKGGGVRGCRDFRDDFFSASSRDELHQFRPDSWVLTEIGGDSELVHLAALSSLTQEVRS